MEIEDIISSGLLELYVLGITTPAENAQVEQWTRQYPEVVAEIDAIQKAMEAYARLHAVLPPGTLKKTIFSELDRNTNLLDERARAIVITPYFKWAAAACILLLIGSAIFNVIYFNKYEQAEIARKDADAAKQTIERQMLAQAEENRIMENDMSVVQSKYSKPVALEGLPASPGAAAKIFWMKNTGEVYVDPTNLPAVPAGKQYQLWAIVDGKPVDAGMISPEKKAGKYRIQKMKSFGKAEAFAITLEKEGGNPAPKGDMYVMGKI